MLLCPAAAVCVCVKQYFCVFCLKREGIVCGCLCLCVMSEYVEMCMSLSKTMYICRLLCCVFYVSTQLSGKKQVGLCMYVCTCLSMPVWKNCSLTLWRHFSITETF